MEARRDSFAVSGALRCMGAVRGSSPARRTASDAHFCVPAVVSRAAEFCGNLIILPDTRKA
eukprot:5939407-Prymnesium_polylepis.1